MSLHGCRSKKYDMAFEPILEKKGEEEGVLQGLELKFSCT